MQNLFHVRPLAPRAKPGFRAAAAIALAAAWLAGCTTQKDYHSGLNPLDVCAQQREPIIKAGNEVEKRQFERAKAIADKRMIDEGKTAKRTGSNDFLADISDSMQRDMLVREEYKKMQANPTGDAAVQMLAMFQGEASNDRARLGSVAATTKALRECRARAIASAQADFRRTESLQVPDPSALNIARQHLVDQRTALAQDDTLINQVFGEFTQMADLLAANKGGGSRMFLLKASTPIRASASETATIVATGSRGAKIRTIGSAKAASDGWQMVDLNGKIGFVQASLLMSPPSATNALDQLARDQASAQSADRKSSDDMRQTLDNALGS